LKPRFESLWSAAVYLIFHITTQEHWQTAQGRGVYQCPSLETEGFIHCSKREQVLKVANHTYRGQDGLVLLCISAPKVEAAIRHELPVDGNGGGHERFPHIYGPLNLDAVVDVVDFPPQADGSFILPEGI
jgi:uncharacterized protein (DUF952 family)